MTLPSMVDVAIMLTDAVRLFGVKTTSNRLAVKPEFGWHAARELDRSTGSAFAGRTKVAREERRKSGLIDGNRILASIPASGREALLVVMGLGGFRIARASGRKKRGVTRTVWSESHTRASSSSGFAAERFDRGSGVGCDNGPSKVSMLVARPARVVGLRRKRGVGKNE